jgi:hypothetical protein
MWQRINPLELPSGDDDICAENGNDVAGDTVKLISDFKRYDFYLILFSCQRILSDYLHLCTFCTNVPSHNGPIGLGNRQAFLV